MAELKRANCFAETAQSRRVPLQSFRNDDLSIMAASASSGKFGLVAGGFGVGGFRLEGEAASGNSKTSTARQTFPLSQNFVAGSSSGALSFSVNGRVSTTPATSAQVSMEVYKSDGAGGVTGSNLVTTSAQTLTNAYGEKVFVVNTSSLSPGDEIEVSVRTVVDDTTGATGAKGQIGSVKEVVTTRM